MMLSTQRQILESVNLRASPAVISQFNHQPKDSDPSLVYSLISSMKNVQRSVNAEQDGATSDT